MSEAPTDPIPPELRNAPVVIVDYDPRWPATFALLRDRVVHVLGDLVVAVEHVGSTAVPNLAAKPIIDIDVVIRSEADFAETVRRLAEIGYTHIGDLGITGREAFLADGALPRHNLYVCAAGASELRRHLLFRDALRADTELTAEYAALKRDLAERFRDDRDAYTEGKTAFITRVLLNAREDRRGRRRR